MPPVFSVSSTFIPYVVTTCAPPIIAQSVATSVSMHVFVIYTFVTSALLPLISVPTCTSIPKSVVLSVSSTNVVLSLSCISNILRVTAGKCWKILAI